MEFEDWVELMSEVPHAAPEREAPEGFTTISSDERRGAIYGGMVAHRSILYPHEYVDVPLLMEKLQEILGESIEDVWDAYSSGVPGGVRRAIRNRLDAKFLEIHEAGGHMGLLGGALGFSVRGDGHCRVLERAIKRAKLARGDAQDQ